MFLVEEVLLHLLQCPSPYLPLCLRPSAVLGQVRIASRTLLALLLPLLSLRPSAVLGQVRLASRALLAVRSAAYGLQWLRKQPACRQPRQLLPLLQR